MKKIIIIISIFFFTVFLNAQINVDQTWINQNLSDGALFFNQGGQTYTFNTDFNAPGTAVFIKADNVTVDLNGHTITFGSNNKNGTIGICPHRERTAVTLGSDDVNYSNTAPYSSCDNAVIKNGRILYGGSSGTWACPIGGYRAGNQVTVDNMYLETTGMDAAGIHMMWSNINISIKVLKIIYEFFVLSHSFCFINSFSTVC